MPEPAPSIQPLQHGAEWITGAEIGKSPRHVRRLFDRLAPLGQARKEGRLLLFARNHPLIVRYVTRAQRDRSYEDLSAYTEHQIEDARAKLRILRTGSREIAERMRATGCGRTVAVEWFATVRAAELGLGPVTVTSYRRWERRVQAAGGYRLKALIDTRGRTGCQRAAFTPEAQDYFKAFYLDDRRRSLRLCWELTTVEAERSGWSVPPYRTVAHWAQHHIPRPALILGREGSKAFASQCTPRVRRSREDTPAGDAWCADECTLDVYCRVRVGDDWKRIRPKLTAWMDERSRYYVGWTIGAAANSDTILAAFKAGVRTWGPPRHVTCDNGEDYKSVGGRRKRRKWDEFDQQRLGSVYEELDIGVTWALPYNPQSKPIESNFRAIHADFDKLWDSYCGKDTESRPEDAAKIPLFDLPTLQEIVEAFGPWLDTYYHERERTGSGMYGLCPRQAMEQFRSPRPREAIDGARLDFLCAKFVGPRTVGKDGVNYRGVYYGQGCEQLWVLQGKQVWLKVQPDEADSVWICDLETRRPIVRAHNQRIAGATQEDVREAQRRKSHHRKVVKQYLAEGHNLLRHTATSEIIKAMATRVRAEQETLAPPPPPEAIQIVRPDVQSALGSLPAERSSNQPQTPAKRRSQGVDFAAINRSFGLGVDSGDEDRAENREARIDGDALLATGRLDRAIDERRPVPADAFDVLTRGRSDRQRAQSA